MTAPATAAQIAAALRTYEACLFDEMPMPEFSRDLLVRAKMLEQRLPTPAEQADYHDSFGVAPALIWDLTPAGVIAFEGLDQHNNGETP